MPIFYGQNTFVVQSDDQWTGQHRSKEARAWLTAVGKDNRAFMRQLLLESSTYYDLLPETLVLGVDVKLEKVEGRSDCLRVIFEKED